MQKEKISWLTILFSSLYLIGIIQNILVKNYLFAVIFSVALFFNLGFVIKNIFKKRQ